MARWSWWATIHGVAKSRGMTGHKQQSEGFPLNSLINLTEQCRGHLQGTPPVPKLQSACRPGPSFKQHNGRGKKCNGRMSGFYSWLSQATLWEIPQVSWKQCGGAGRREEALSSFKYSLIYPCSHQDSQKHARGGFQNDFKGVTSFLQRQAQEKPEPESPRGKVKFRGYPKMGHCSGLSHHPQEGTGRTFEGLVFASRYPPSCSSPQQRTQSLEASDRW